MDHEEILRRLRLLISLFDEEDTELVVNSKKAILGKPHQDEVCDLFALFDFLETAIADEFLNFESFGREFTGCEDALEESIKKCKKLCQENSWLKKQLARREK